MGNNILFKSDRSSRVKYSRSDVDILTPGVNKKYTPPFIHYNLIECYVRANKSPGCLPL